MDAAWVAGRPLIVIPGRISTEKGYAVAVEALSRLPNAALVAAGGAPPGGEPVAELLLKADAARVRVTGTLTDEGMWAWIGSATVVALPYLTGTGSYAASLAAAAGVPLVTSDLAAFEDLGAVRRARRGDAASLAREITAVVCDAGEQERLRGVSRLYASASSWERSSQLHVALYREATGK
jgi:D-inositol-3-phosphate glycosyltransferase